MNLEKIRSFVINNKFKEEEIQNHKKISKFYMNNFKYFLFYYSDVESQLT